MDKETQKTFLRSIEKSYRYLADILITQGRFVEAQRILNLFKDQQFFDYNQNSNQSIKQIIQSPRESENAVRYQQTSEQIGIIGQQIEDLKKIIGISRPTTEQTTQMQKLEQSLKSATDDFFNFLKQAEVEFSKPADEQIKPAKFPIPAKCKLLCVISNKQTGQKTVAVYTFVGKENFRALIISPDEIKAVSFPIKRTELNEKALKLWALLQSDKYDTTVLSKQIYETVFAPSKQNCRRIRRRLCGRWTAICGICRWRLCLTGSGFWSNDIITLISHAPTPSV